MKKIAFSVMIITILSKFLGFGREIVLSYVYGASAITDAYLISQTIPAVILVLLVRALPQALSLCIAESFTNKDN